MDKNAKQTGSPISLAELRVLGEFVRWQDIESRLADLTQTERQLTSYPIVPTRLPEADSIDLCIGERWRQVEFVRVEGSRSQGNLRIVFVDDGDEENVKFEWYKVAPAGHYTDWAGPKPESLAGAKLQEAFKLAQRSHIIHSQQLVSEDWPYLTFEVKSFDPNARSVDLRDMWTATYTVHAADPRVKIDEIVTRNHWFNTTIAVSHRWLQPEHPDPDRVQFDELISLSGALGLHDNQAFLIDYCSLPQQPRKPADESWFRDNLSGFQSQFKYATLVLNAGSADYSRRAWCMLELMLAAMNRAPQTTLLNHDWLDEPLRHARDLAEDFLQNSIWNHQQMKKSFGGGLSNSSFKQWARDPMNAALYNSCNSGRRDIRAKFEHELEVTDPNDRSTIVELLERLAFGQSGS